jgi:hypothetical protein
MAMLRSLFSARPARQLRTLAPLLLLLAALLLSATSPGGTAAASGPDAAVPTSGSTTISFRDLQPVAVPTPIFRWTFVPDCAGLTQFACENLLTNAGLQRGTLTFLLPTTPPPYIGSVVVAQSPWAGQIVLRGSSVDLTLKPLSRLGPLP